MKMDKAGKRGKGKPPNAPGKIVGAGLKPARTMNGKKKMATTSEEKG
jgi:hypothetical protein